MSNTPCTPARLRELRKLVQRLAFFYRDADLAAWLALDEPDIEAVRQDCLGHWTRTQSSRVLRAAAWAGAAAGGAWAAWLMATSATSGTGAATVSGFVLTGVAVLFLAACSAGAGALLATVTMALANGGREQALEALEPAGTCAQRCAQVLALVREFDTVRAYRDGLVERERTLRQFDLGRMELLAFLAREEARRVEGRTACQALHGLA